MHWLQHACKRTNACKWTQLAKKIFTHQNTLFNTYALTHMQQHGLIRTDSHKYVDDTKTQTPQQACTNMHTLKLKLILTLYNTQAFIPHTLARVTQGQTIMHQ